MDYSTPYQHFEDAYFLVTEFQIKDKEDLFAKDPKKFLAFSPIRYSLPLEDETYTGLNVILEGHVTTQGIFKSTRFDNQPPTLGVGLNEFPDGTPGVSVFLMLEQELGHSIPGYRVTSVVKNDGLYLKLKTAKEGDYFDFTSDIPLSPSLIKDSGLVKDQPIKVAVEVFTYYNVRDKVCGLVFKVLEIQTKDIEPELQRFIDIVPETPPNTPAPLSPPAMKRRKSLVPQRLNLMVTPRSAIKRNPDLQLN